MDRGCHTGTISSIVENVEKTEKCSGGLEFDADNKFSCG
jgi:hypothetical protein